jgi:SsrA-binding protein
MNKKSGVSPLIGENRKARHYYDFLEFAEAGLVLRGSEVKSLRLGQVNFLDSYVDFRQGEAWLTGMHIAPYSHTGNYDAPEPDRDRKLLLHGAEIRALAAKVEQKGLTVVPLKLYFKAGKVKVELALARGRKLHDQRDELKRRAEERDTRRELAG